MKHSILLEFGRTLNGLRAGFKHVAFCVAMLIVMAAEMGQAATIGASENDRNLAIQALRAADKKHWSAAQVQIARTSDPLAAQVFFWVYYTSAEGPFPFDQISGFVRQIPDWPQQGTLQLAVEKSVRDNTPDDDIIRWFHDYSPKTVDGMEFYLNALRRKGQIAEMGRVINAWWGDASLTPDQQDRFLRSYGKLIERDTHRRRFNTTLYKGQSSNARGIARILGKGYPDLAEARIILAAGQSGAEPFLARIPATLKNDPELLLERLRWRRKRDLDFGALEILHNAPPMNLVANPDDWWKERHIQARRLMERKQYESAYLLVSKHGLSEGASYADAQFLAGWLALRFLKKPWEGFQRFEALYHNSTMPITKARAAYWAGLASESLGHSEIARQWYQSGARYPTTFYGQMALAKLGRESEPVTVIPPLTVETRAAFERNDKIRAAKLFFSAGLEDDASAFIRAYADKAATADQFYLAASLANDWKHPHDSVAIAKKAQTKGVVLADYAFPTMLAQMKPLKTEWALIHGIIRQESAFDTQALSPAGARGLMQLMPGTAKETAKKAGIGYENEWLTSRPDYNIKIGSLYIAKMLSRFDGNYPMAIAAYNAGPGRVNGWLRENGDPRQGNVDMIDWIEMIPVAETRNYVQRVLEGIYIYRHKFASLQKATGQLHIAYNQKPHKA
jgi:soluble lytic murein transglycosylase